MQNHICHLLCFFGVARLRSLWTLAEVACDCILITYNFSPKPHLCTASVYVSLSCCLKSMGGRERERDGRITIVQQKRHWIKHKIVIEGSLQPFELFYLIKMEQKTHQHHSPSIMLVCGFNTSVNRMSSFSLDSFTESQSVCASVFSKTTRWPFTNLMHVLATPISAPADVRADPCRHLRDSHAGGGLKPCCILQMMWLRYHLQVEMSKWSFFLPVRFRIFQGPDKVFSVPSGVGN